VPPEGIDLFLDAYGRDVLFGAATRESVWRRLRRELASRERQRLESRSKRCLKRSTLFDVVKEGETRTYHLRARSRKELAALWTRDPRGKLLKRSSRGWVAAAGAAGADVCVKYRAYTWPESLLSLVRAHRLRRAYTAGHALRVRGIASPRVIALHERRPLGCVREAHLVTELIPGATRLDRHLMDEYWGKPRLSGPSSRRKHDLARRIGRFVRALHDAKISAGDLSPQNLLVTAGAAEETPETGLPPLHLVDLDDVHVAEDVSLRERGRNLVQLGNLPEGHITTVDLLRALRAYAGGDERYWNRRWIHELREALLDEHLRVVVRRAAGGREQGR
jgi:tRNA A-37 threonylcarbamoyl transferase component Bud32